MLFKSFKKLFIISIVSITILPAHAQDLLAHQASIDSKMKNTKIFEIDAIDEVFKDESAGLYNNWNNQAAHSFAPMPESFKIDLRGFCMPTPSRKITSPFGPRWGRMHKGLDIKVYVGDTIRAAFDGVIRVARVNPGGYGNFVVIRHYNGLETVYGHLSKWLVQINQKVKAGDVIGLGGNTGRSTGSHLHFETRLCGTALNPAVMFDFYNQDVTGDYYVYTKNKYESDQLAATKRVKEHIGRGDVNSGKSYTAGRGKNVRYSNNTASASTYNNKDTKLEQNKAPEIKHIGEPSRNATKGHVAYQYHKVAQGETLASIAQRRGVSLDELCKKNRISKNYKITPGQILVF